SNHRVRLWARNPDVVDRLARERVHQSHPSVELPAGLTVTADLAGASGDADAIVVACPSHAVRSLAASVSAHAPKTALVVSTAKGVETDSRLTMSAVLGQVLPAALSGRVAVLSGPSFAREVAQ